MDESLPLFPSSSAMGSGTTSTSSIHRRDRHEQPSSSPSIGEGPPLLSDNITTRRPSLAPPLGEFRIDPSSPCIVSTSQPQQPAPTAIDPLMSDDSGSERGVKRRRRSSAFERCDEMRRMSMKRCNGSGSFSAGTGGSAATVGREVEGQHRPHEQDGTHHPTPTTNVTGSLVSSTSSSSSTTSASASTSSLVLDLHATTLPSSPQPLPRPRTRPQPVFTCPFTSYTKDRQDRTQPHPLHCSEDHPHEICGRDRRNSSISSQYTRRDSGWSTTESRRGTLTSGFSSPSTSISAVDMTSQHNKQECKPFPMDRLPQDILNLILDHVLKSPEFGHNGRWKDKQGLDEDKVQMVKALKASASIHLKFSLIHRSWTPHVIKSLYRFPRLTSKDAIEKFDRAIQNPLSLWGSELMPDGQIGGVLGSRGRYVRFISYCVGSGRHSATDYLMWSGSWFADVAGRLIAQLTNIQGWACEGWCSKGCEESRQIEIFKYPEEDRIVLERLTILRSPLPADILALTLSQTKGMRALELLDVQKHYLIDGNLELVKRGLKMATCLETFAIKVEGGVEQEGPLDDVLTIVPTLRHLSMQADLLSLNFFAISRTSELQSILIGFATRLPVLFHGREALETLWSEAQAETIYSRARQQAQFVFAEGTTFEGSVTHRMTLNSTMISINGAANARSSPAPSMVFNQPLMLSSSSPRPGPFLTTNDMEGSSLSSIPQLGLESWLVRELGNPNSAISKASLTGDDAMAVYASYTHHPPV